MKHTNELMLSIAQFLYGNYGAEEFSFAFPAALAGAYDDFQAENARLCGYLEEQMPELCAAFDPHGTGDPDAINEETFREKVLQVYRDALPLSMRVS